MNNKIDFALYDLENTAILRFFLNTKRGKIVYTQEFRRMIYKSSDKHYFYALKYLIREVERQISEKCLWEYPSERKRVLTKNTWISAKHPTAILMDVFRF